MKVYPLDILGNYVQEHFHDRQNWRA